MEGPSVNATDSPCASEGRTLQSGIHLHIAGTVQLPIEGIFQDLLAGTRIEEALKHWNRGLKGDVEVANRDDSARGEEMTEMEVPSNKWSKELGRYLVDEALKTELADAMMLLEAAYWLNRQASGKIDSLFYHSVLSHSNKQHSPQSEIKRMRSHNTNIIPNLTSTNLLPTFMRYYRFSEVYSWKLLTLLSLSRSFRKAASDLSETEWQNLLKIVLQNKGSFELISKSARPQYGALLFTMFKVLEIKESIIDNPSDAWMAVNNWIYDTASITCNPSGTKNLDDPMALEYLNHPHRWCVTVSGQSIMPVDPVYIPLEESVLRAKDFTNENDPRYIGGDCEAPKDSGANRRKVCEFCEARGIAACSCTLRTLFPAPLIEIIETDGKGLGVRSLQTIKKGAVLGEYAGLIRVDATKGDVYSLNGHLDITDEKFYLTTSKDMGNFTRFVNHSCSPNCFFSAIIFRGRKVSVLVAVENIELFDEITADYGDEYFLRRGMECRCGTEGCKINGDGKRDPKAEVEK